MVRYVRAYLCTHTFQQAMSRQVHRVQKYVPLTKDASRLTYTVCCLYIYQCVIMYQATDLDGKLGL